MSTVEILQKARDLISDPKRWTQDAYARDDFGNETVSFGSSAVPESSICFCSIGAIASVAKSTITEAETGEAFKLIEAGISAELAVYNDTHTHAEVLAAFDRAIEKAKASAGAA